MTNPSSDHDHDHATGRGHATGPGLDPGSDPAFGAQWWEQHYQGEGSGTGAPSPPLVADLAGLPSGSALDAGCGTGADAVWLARHGWAVTAVDVSPTAVSRAERLAADQDPEAAGRITWVVADLTTWAFPQQYDLVVSQYVHPGTPFAEFVARLADAVAPDGTLYVAGHDDADVYSAAHAPEDPSIGADAVVAVLSPDRWDVEVAETRSRPVRHGSTEATMHDVVVRARRRPSVRGR